MHEEATEPPVEWVFELENGHAEEVLVPPASGPSNSWLSWLQGAHDAPTGHRQVFSRESDQSAGTLPCESRDPDALPGHEPRGVFGIMGNWFAEPDDNPLPPPMPSRMDEDDHSLGGHSSHHVKWAVDDEVVPERMQRTASQATSLPPASNMVVGSEAVRDAEVRSDYSDGFLADVAAAYMSAHGDDHRAPEPEPPLPPPERPPEGEPQGFYEVPLAAAAAPMAYAVEKPRSPVQAADVAVIVESEESTGHTKCAKCKAACGCLCLKGQKSKTEEEEEAFRTTTTKLLDEEIQDFSGSAAHGCVAWVSHRCLARLPLCCVIAGFLISVTIISVGMVVRPLEVEIDWDSFLKTDVNTSTMRDVFLFALQHRDEKSERRLTEGRQLQGNRLYKHNDIFLAYQIPESANAGPDGLLGPAFLSKVRSFERKLRTTPEWIRLCNRSDTIDRPLCDLGVSLVNYVFPSPMIAGPDVVPSQLNYDAGGPQALAPQVAMVLMEDHNVKDIIIPPGYEEGTPLRTVRTAFRFKWFCCTSLQSGAEQRQVLNEMRDTWSTFLDDTVIPMLRQEVATRPENLEIYYTGSTLYSKEVTSTLFGDLMLAAGSISFVLFYLILHTQSILLGFMGLVIIVGAIPLSYVVFAVVTGSNTMSIASFLSVFLIVGLGSDVVFVYTDFWADSKSRKVNYGSRMTWTLIHAGKASLATSVTTALSFFANLASVLKPLREFGFFMGLCVIVVWLLLSLVYVPLCMVDEFWCRRCRLPCGQFFNYMKASPVKISPREESDGPDAHPTVSKYTRVIQKFRRSICVFPVVVSIGFIIWAVLVLRVDTGVPSIFPEDHNLNKGSEVLSTFYDTSQVFNPLWLIDRPQADVCNTAIFTPISSNYNVGSWAYNCNLNWCEADPDVSQLEDDTCHCWRRAEGNCSQSFATVSTKIIAPRRLVQEDEGAIADYFEAVDGVSVTNTQRQNLQRSALSVSPPIVTEEWERGLREVREVTEVLGTVQRDSVTASCAFQDVCFCNSWSCKMPGSEWQKVRSIRIPGINETTSRRLSGEDFEAQPRSLDVLSPSEYTVSPANRATVEAVFGITVTATSLLLGEVDLENGWTFAELHQVSQPWAQRNMYSFCTSFPKSLRVVEKRCWMESFRTWLLERGNRFPIVESQFRALIVPFAESSLTGMHSTKDFLWLRDGEVKASYVPITVDFATYADTASALDFKERWDKYLDDFNLEASIYTKGAWHTSVVWVRAEAQSALIQSTIVTIVIVVALALLGMLVFTKDSKLSALVVASTLIVIFALTWFIVVVMAWPIGPIEVIALIVFIGYAVTYSLHIAHRYGSPLPYDHDATMPPDDIRFLRTVLALASIGGAALGSAVTTAGCSIFLVFCTLTIFQKLGGVVLVVTLMSIGVALIPLPAALLWFGPVRPGRCFCFYPTETYDNVINARVNMVENLQKRREEQNRLREEKAEMKRQESERKQLEKEAEEERMKKEKEEEEARQRREAQEKARQLAKGKSKAKAKASLSRTRSLESGDVKRTSTASQDRRRSDGELAPQVAPHRSSDIKASASRASGDPTPSSRLTASGLDVGEEATREFQGH